MQKFWWGYPEKDSRIHWMSWKNMGQPKVKEGMVSGILIFSTRLYWQSKCRDFYNV
jgi:hypothetical protein